jgi:hypothetical protein
MIPPREQWCIQIDVTNACPRACSNCTRLAAHARAPFFMTVDGFARAVEAVRDFPAESPPDAHGRRKLIGLIGGEPLVHPQFAELCRIMAGAIPARGRRGLWTGLRWAGHAHRAIVRRTFGYVNQNLHTSPCVHQPVLVAIRDVIRQPSRMWELIDACELQRKWSSAITPKGFFFCEVAAAMDLVFEGPGGLAIEPGCWRHDLARCQEQIERWCPQCGVCLPLAGRRDSEGVDDISRSNLDALRELGSPRVKRGDYVLFDPSRYDEREHRAGWRPLDYLEGRGR